MRDRLMEAVLLLLALGFALLGFGLPEIGAAGDYDPAQRDPEGLRVVTWNVGGGAGPRGRPFDDAHLSAVAASIRALDADLVFLQEVRTDRQLDRLWGLLGRDRWRALTAYRNARRVAVLAQRGGLRRFSVRPRGTGRVLGVIYTPDDGRPPVAAVGLHADAYSPVRRNAEVGHAVDRLLAGEFAPARILAGDLNLDLDLDKKRELFTPDDHRDVETYNYVANRFVDASRGTGSTAEPDRRLDYIFVSRHFEVVAAGPWRGRRRGDMDHDPVVADLRFRGR